MVYKGILQIDEIRLVARSYLQIATTALLILGLLGGWAGSNWPTVLMVFILMIATIIGIGRHARLRGAGPLHLYASAIINLTATALIVILTGGVQSPFWLLFLIGAITSAMSFQGRVGVNLEILNSGIASLTLLGPELVNWPPKGSLVALAGMKVAILLLSSLMIRRITSLILASRESVAESEERYRKLVEHARDVIFTIAVDGKITSLNPAFEIFMGWSRADWLGRSFDELVVGSDSGRAHDQFERILRGETLRALRLNVRTRYGETLVVEMNISPQYKDGQVIGLLGIARDMTQEQRSEDALRASERRFRSLIEGSHDGIVLGNAEGLIGYMSPSTRRILGYDPEELVGRPGIEQVHPDDQTLLLQELADILRWPEKTVVVQCRVRHKDNSWRWVEAVVRNMLYDPDIQAWVGNYRDITGHKQSEEKIHAAERLLRNTLDTLPVFVGILTLEGVILDANWLPLETFGLDYDDIVGRPLYDVRPWSDSPQVQSQLREAIKQAAQGETIHYDLELPALAGGSAFFSFWLSPIVDEAGQVVYLVPAGLDITERKRADEQIYYQASLLANVNDAIIASDENSRITAWNSAAELMYGWKADEVIGQIGAEIVKTEFERTSRADVLNILAKEGRWRGEVTQARRDGSRFFVETASIVLRNMHGGITGYVSVNRDVTGRKQAEAALRESEARYHDILDAMLEGCQIIDFDWRYVYVNGVVAAQGRRRPDELLNHTMMEMYPGIENTELFVVLQRCMKERVSKRMENPFTFPDGSLGWFELSIQPAREGIFILSTDITDRKSAEEKLARQNKRLTVLREIDTAILSANSVESIVDVALSHVRELMDCHRAAMALIDEETKEVVVFDVKSAGETSLSKGYRIPLETLQDMSQSLSKNQPMVIDDLTELSDLPPMFQTLSKEGLRSVCILPLFSQSRQIGAFNVSSESPGFFDEGKISLGREVANQVAIAITQSRLLNELEEHLRERETLIADLTAKNAELERFIYTVSHELKSPLVTIKGYLGYLEQDAISGNMERLNGDAQRISNAVEKMKELLNDLLELSRIGRLMNPSRKTPFDNVVRDALEIVHGQLEAHGVTVHTQPDLPIVFGDRQRLTEILQNLLDNAAKYKGEQTNPLIEIGQQGEAEGHPVFFVRDNGIGIPPVYHERIFGLFNKLNPQSEGTGIGLALVKRIVEFHGGRIWVESDGVPGEGSTFYFTLPRG